MAGYFAKREVTVYRKRLSVVGYERISKVFLHQATYPPNPRPAIYSCGGGARGETGMCGGRPSNTLPCMTLRDNAEHPETITIGPNELIGTDPNMLPRRWHD